MKFNTIREFIDLVPDCQHCGNPLQTFIKSRNTPNTRARYNMTFDATTWVDPFEDDLLNMHLATDDGQITYHSVENDNILLFIYRIKESVHPIFSINKNTNYIDGERDKIQKVLWDHKPVIRRQCVNEVCLSIQRNYIYETSSLILERITQKVYPFFLDTEVLTVDHNNDVYGLMSIREMRSTFLMARHNMIKDLPFFPLYRIKGSAAIYNKIRTLVNFS